MIVNVSLDDRVKVFAVITNDGLAGAVDKKIPSVSAKAFGQIFYIIHTGPIPSSCDIS
jgi:hypothetical protein